MGRVGLFRGAPTRRWVTGLVVIAGLASASLAQATSIASLGTVSYTEQSSSVQVAPNISITGGTSYDGKYLDFAVSGATSADNLSYSTVGTASTTNGVVSVVGTSVYLGNGSSADPIGSIDATRNGQNGQPLRINFVSSFSNSGFESGTLSGWTPVPNRIDLNSTFIAGVRTEDTTTYGVFASSCNPTHDNTVPATMGNYTVQVVTSTRSEGSYSLELKSSGVITANGGDVVHGPAVYSEPFQASQYDVIRFDWRAVNGDDNYKVYGYILNTGTNAITEVLDASGRSSSASTNWAEASVSIPATGSYRFVFVAGTQDYSCGTWAGAALYIDNVRVFGSKVNDAVATNVAKLVRYSNTSDNPAASRTVAITAVGTGGTTSANATVSITGTDDPPTLSSPSASTFTNTGATDTFTAVTGTLSATDPDGDALTYGISGGTAESNTFASVTYDTKKVGSYGTLYVKNNGAFRFEPDATAINNELVTSFEDFTVSAAASGVTATNTYRVNISVPASAPNAPVNLSATGGVRQVVLTWDAPAWLGGSNINDYIIQQSTNGTSWTTFTDGTSSATTATVTGLSNNTPYYFRVAAKNSTGTGANSSNATATTHALPGAPTGVTVSATNQSGELLVSWTAPASTGGSAITDYALEYSTNGTSWTAFSDSVSSNTTATLTGLTNGTTYFARVAAITDVGTGSTASSASSAAPRSAPGAPTLSALTEGNGQVDISVTAVANGDPVSDYEYQLDGTGAWTSLGTDSSPITITGLTNGTAYDVRVRAVNTIGPGPSSAALSVLPSTTATATTGATSGVGTTAATLNASVNPSGASGTVRFVWGTSPTLTSGNSSTTAVQSPVSSATSTSVSATLSTLNPATKYYTKVGIVTNRKVNGTATNRSEVYGAITSFETRAAAPTSASATPGDQQATVSWTAPASDGIVSLSYTVTASSGSASCTTSTTSCTVTGLSNGTAYTFTVIATTGGGDSAPSTATTAVTPRGLPAVTTDLSTLVTGTTARLNAVVSANGDATTSEFLMSTNSAMSNPQIISIVGSQSSNLSPTSAALTNLTPATKYWVRTRATNQAGTSTSANTTSFITQAVAPTNLIVTPANESLVVAWTTSVSPGAGVTLTHTARTNDNKSCTATSTASAAVNTCTIIGLSNGGTYTVQVASAVSGADLNGAPVVSDTSAAVTPRTIAAAPTAVSAVGSGAGKVKVSFLASATNGGATITGYTITCTSSDGGATVASTITTTSTEFTNATAGKTYTCSVVAVNAAGSSTAATSSPTVAAELPNAPQGLIATVSRDTTIAAAVPTAPLTPTVVVTWSEPSSTGGLPISKYVVKALSSTDRGVVESCSSDGATRTCALTTLTGPATFIITVEAMTSLGSGQVTESSVFVRGEQIITPATIRELTATRSVKFTATATSTLPVAITTTGPCDMVRDTLVPTAAGVCIVTMNQGGDLQWSPAPQATLNIRVREAPVVTTTMIANLLLSRIDTNTVAPARRVATPANVTPQPRSVQPGTVSVVESSVDSATTSTVSQTTTMEVIDDQTLLIESAEVSTAITPRDEAGNPLPVDNNGVVTVRAGLFADIHGEGYQPGSQVDTWLFSEPTYLGQTDVLPDGTFAARLEIPNHLAGEHTLKMVGTNSNGVVTETAVGVKIEKSPDVLMPVAQPAVAPETSSQSWVWFAIAGVAVAGGLLFVGTVARRRRRA